MATVFLIVLSAILALFLAFLGINKLADTKIAVERAAQVGVSLRLNRAIGVLESLAAVGLIVGAAGITAVGAAAAAGVVLLMIGAAITHVRVGHGPALIIPAGVTAVLAVAILALAVTS